MKWRQIIPTAVTLLAMLAGFFSILVTLEGIRSGVCSDYLASAQLIMFAMVMDGLDGNLARKLKGASAFGAELDTYVDMTAFGIAPAVLIYAVSLQNAPYWRFAMTSAVVVSGVVRLARFKVKDPDRGQRGYVGLPITASATWVSMLVFLSQRETGFLSLSEGPVATIFLLGILVFILLQVSNVRYPKPTKIPAIFVPSAVLVLLLFIAQSAVATFSAITIIVFGLVYVVVGPWFVRGMEAKRTRVARKMAASPNLEPTEQVVADTGKSA